MDSISHFTDKFTVFKEDESQLESIAQKYPWCSLAQLALLHSYKKNNTSLFDKQGNKTALFFNNTNWLNWQLHLLSEETVPEETVRVEESSMPVQETLPEEIQNENVQRSLKEISSQANTTEETIAFEPLYTTDYFASQGIKLTDEPVTNDKLGSQVKSFTEWLKSMKRIHTDEEAPAGNEQTDKNIQQIAEHSNEAAEVVTEAMADVLVKQEKTGKAIEVYRKLSLIYPSKSAYFAAKIQALSANDSE